nr:septal ring lytic transglycosylase RlpA family protein [Halorhodospira halophila]
MATALLGLAGGAALLAGCAAPERDELEPPRPDEDPAERVATDGASDRDPEELARLPDAVPQDVPPSRYGNPEQYEVFGETYATMSREEAEGFTQRGRASWYGTKFHGRRTSSGTPYDMYAMTAAHRELPLPTWVEVVNLENDRRAVVKVNDRGPFVDPDERILDLSYAAAVRLDIADQGTAPVQIRVVTPDDPPQSPAKDADAEAGDPPAEGGVETFSVDDEQEPDAIEELLAAQEEADAEPGDETPSSEPPAGVRVRTTDRLLQDAEAVQPIAVYLQTGVFGQRENAERMEARLADLDLEAEVSVEEIGDADGSLHRVRLGPLENLAEIDRVEQGLDEAGIDHYRVSP